MLTGYIQFDRSSLNEDIQLKAPQKLPDDILNSTFTEKGHDLHATENSNKEQKAHILRANNNAFPRNASSAQLKTNVIALEELTLGFTAPSGNTGQEQFNGDSYNPYAFIIFGRALQNRFHGDAVWRAHRTHALQQETRPDVNWPISIVTWDGWFSNLVNVW